MANAGPLGTVVGAVGAAGVVELSILRSVVPLGVDVEYDRSK